MEPVPGYRFASWELGYGDFHLVPDLGTLRLASWLEKTALVLCDVKSEKTHDLVGVAPRSILRQQVDAASEIGKRRVGKEGRARWVAGRARRMGTSGTRSIRLIVS